MKQKIKRWLKPVSTQATAPNAAPTFSCPLCASTHTPMPFPVALLEDLHRHQFKHNILLTETVNFAQYACSHCLATDRDRLYALYLQDWFNNNAGEKKVLEIGPSGPIRKWLSALTNISYRCADLFRIDVDDNVDITDMQRYADNSFDVVICSHVLEHVGDDRTAMKELCRILHPNGIGIIMVPINLGVSVTEEDPDCTDIAQRWHRFGQDDHIRMYSKADYIERLQAAGFTVTLLDETHFGKPVFAQHGIFPTSVLYITTKSA